MEGLRYVAPPHARSSTPHTFTPHLDPTVRTWVRHVPRSYIYENCGGKLWLEKWGWSTGERNLLKYTGVRMHANNGED